ncbi:MAG: transporter substrate-binding domain-containing protein [Bacilli bacterium]|jgi:ABC-type amino acid transport substrate-binding protein|nr:transporter substrate-binding domain-containing protein [Bacilli bacterium]
MRKTSRSIILGLCLILILVTGCSSSKKTESAIADGTLTIGLECDYAPYNYTTTEALKTDNALPISGSAGYCDGYDIAIADRIAKALNVKVEVKKMSWDGLIPALESGQIDAIIAGMSPTAERKKSIDFTDSYFHADIVDTVVVKKDGKYANANSLDGFSGAKITAQQGTVQVKLVSQLKGVTEVANMPDYSSLIQSLKAGTIDGYIAEESVAKEHVEQNSDFKYIPLNFTLTAEDTDVAIGISKDQTELKDKLNEALKTISDQERQELMNYYISKESK